MRFTKLLLKAMKIKINNFTTLLNKISISQVFIVGLIGVICLINKKDTYFTGLLISGFAASCYTQLIKLSSYSKTISFLGFPLRLLIIAPPCAILVHKLHSNLIALFIGFAICQFIFVLLFWLSAKKLIKAKAIE